jgi:hypothetical protein
VFVHNLNQAKFNQSSTFLTCATFLSSFPITSAQTEMKIYATAIIGERPYLSTKIITLSEFFNFVHQVSRL